MQTGKRVLVLEQHEIAGGAMAPITVGEEGYLFDYGVHYAGEMGGTGPAKFFFDQVPKGYSSIIFPVG